MGCGHKTGNHTLGVCLKPTVRMLQLYQLQCSLRESQREASIASLLPVVKPFNYTSLSFKSVCARACAFERVSDSWLHGAGNGELLWKETWYAFKESGGRERRRRAVERRETMKETQRAAPSSRNAKREREQEMRRRETTFARCFFQVLVKNKVILRFSVLIGRQRRRLIQRVPVPFLTGFA